MSACMVFRILLLINKDVRLSSPLKLFSSSSSKLFENKNNFFKLILVSKLFSGSSDIKF